MKLQYGPVFRKFREEKHYTLQQVSEGITSVSFLSKFERGDSDISLSNFTQLIGRMHVSMDEFIFAANEYNISEMDLFINRVMNKYQSNNILGLKKLKDLENLKFQQTKEKSFFYNSIMVELLIADLNEKEVNQERVGILVDYLFSVDHWSNYELILYGNTLMTFPIESVIVLSKEVLKRGQLYRNVRKNFEMIIQIMLNTVTICLETNYLEEAQFFMISIQNIGVSEILFYERTKLLFLKGLYDIKKGNVEIGKAKADNSIHIMESIGATNLAINHQDYLDKIFI